MDRFADSKPLNEATSRLWRLMQNIEFCRHRAEIAERRAAAQDGPSREASLAVAQAWRGLARAFEMQGEAAEASVTRIGAR